MSSEAEGIVDLYQRKALDWVRNRERAGGLMEKSWLDRFRALGSPTASILDIGCGSGVPISRYLIEAGHRVTGVDSSATLIDLCRDRFPAHEWIVADMRKLALGRLFDGIMAWDSFFHLCADDQRQMFPVFRQHAAPGAALMFTSGPAHGEAIGDFEGEPLYHASLDPDDYRSLLDQHGFRVVSHVVEDMNCGRHTVWLAQRV
jgi:2-polyprenyl-3-methyl-5-hydroxy-6-metoxy-1,4-benzoquinol methylase